MLLHSFLTTPQVIPPSLNFTIKNEADISQAVAVTMLLNSFLTTPQVIPPSLNLKFYNFYQIKMPTWHCIIYQYVNIPIMYMYSDFTYMLLTYKIAI